LIHQSREKQRKFEDRLLAIPPVELTQRVILQFRDDDGSHLAAGVAYYGILSIFPLLVGIMAIASLFVDRQSAWALVSELIKDSAPGSSEFLEQRIADILEIRRTVTLFGLFGLLWSASAMFGSITDS
jgi:membrane protein